MSDHVPPWAGEVSDEYRAVCLYSRRPSEPQCDAPATIHVLSETDRYGEVAFPACDQHAAIARSAGRFVMEHRYAGLCGFPATIWHLAENVCLLDDSGEEPVLVGVVDGEGRTDAR